MTIKNKKLQRQKLSVLLLPFAFLLLPCLSFAQTLAPGAPGKDAQWSSAGKQAIGTSASLESKVWFTLQNGALSEIYYPDVTVANVHLLQFVVVNKKNGEVETEKDDTTQTIEVLSPNTGKTFPPAPPPPKSAQGVEFYNPRFQFDTLERTQNSPTSLMFRQTNWAKDKKWRIRKQYITDPGANTVLIDFEFSTDLDSAIKGNAFEIYVYYDPSINNTGMHDTAWTQSGILMASDGNKVSALTSLIGFTKQTNGFYGTSDGLTQLLAKKELQFYDRAENGNVVQFAKLDFKTGISGSGRIYFDDELTLGFGKNADEAINAAKSSLKKRYQKAQDDYHQGWTDYIKTTPKVETKYQAQFNMAAMVLKAQEDKTVRGANVASLTIPWGGGANANEDVGGGYHLVWSRDLYHVFTAYLALGDVDAASRALDFLFKIQQKPDGSFPQNSWLDGKKGWGSLQLDEVAYPLIMAYQLRRFDRATYENHVKKAADFLVKTGPKTPQERWEEKSGYSPSTIAAEIAGLVCAAEIALRNNDAASRTVYLATADDWARNVERWTATTKGKYGDGNYYLRLTENGAPDANEKTVLNNNAGTFNETEIVDAGFLELVRLGIKSPDDPLIVKSLKVVDQILRVNTPNGEAFYRYNNDGYGEMDDGRRWNWDGKYTGKGRLWALLAGERGQYALALSNVRKVDFSKADEPLPRDLTAEEDFKLKYGMDSKTYFGRKQAEIRLDSMARFANEGLMIPEQIWDKSDVPKNIDKQFIPELKFGEGTGSATPLAWSMAQFIRLAVNLQAGKNLDTPDIVYDRYVKNKIGGQTGFNILSPAPDDLAKLRAGEVFTVKGTATPNSMVAYLLGEQRDSVKVGADGKFSLTAKMPAAETDGFLTIVTPDNSSFVSLNKIGGAPKMETTSAELLQKIQAATVSPLIDGDCAIFIYRGAAAHVELVGDTTGWQPRGLVFQGTPGNQYLIVPLDRRARVEYKYIIGGKDWISDPSNPNRLDNGVGSENSVLTMPEYQPTGWDKTDKPAKIEEIEIESKIYGKRRVKIYQPPINDKTPLPTLYFQDGTDYITRAKAVETQENLVKAGRIKPFVMVFIDPKERTKEYWASDDYARFLAMEIVPAIDAKYNTVKNRDGRAVLGASLGGITSVWVGLKYPEIFSRLGGQSSSFWVDDERVINELSKLDAEKTKFRFYFDDGALEGTDDSRRVNVMLRGKNYPVVYREETTGHNWTSWRDRLADAFVALWEN